MPRTMLTTTLATGIGATDQQLILASVANVSNGKGPPYSQTILFIDKEAILVILKPVASTVPLVLRGYLGTAATPHSTGAVVYLGPATAYALYDPSGKIPTGADIMLPWIVPSSGNIWGDDGTGNWKLLNGSGGGGGSSGPAGSAALDFPAIADGAISELTFAVAGVLAGDRIAPSWPSALNTGLTGSMFASAAGTVTVRLANLSGATIDPALLTYGAQAVR